MPNTPKVSIIGSGRVGSTTALILAMKELADVTLVDIIEKVPQGEALDIMHGAASGFGSKVTGTNDFSGIANSDIVINTAGMARRPGMDRLDLLNRNVQILKSVADKIKKYSPETIVLQVSNPMDALNYVMRKATGFPTERVMGMGGMLDSQRLSLHIANELNGKPNLIKSMVIGEHGESQVPLFSQTMFEGKPVGDIINEQQKEDITKKLRASGSEVIGLKGATIFAPALAITSMLDNILNDKKQVMPCSVHLEGEYGNDGIAIGVPARLGRKGVEGVVELDLNEKEMDMFNASAKKMKSVIEELKL